MFFSAIHICDSKYQSQELVLTYTLVSLLANFVGRTICTTLVYNNNNNTLFMHCNLGTHND